MGLTVLLGGLHASRRVAVRPSSSARIVVLTILLAPLWILVVLPLWIAGGVLFLWLLLMLQMVTVVWWLPRGRRVIFVYSNSPVWREYVEERILPRLPANAAILNWSERSRWPFWSVAVWISTFTRAVVNSIRSASSSGRGGRRSASDSGGRSAISSTGTPAGSARSSTSSSITLARREHRVGGRFVKLAPEILAYYERFAEENRLASGSSQLEFERTKEILARVLPARAGPHCRRWRGRGSVFDLAVGTRLRCASGRRIGSSGGRSAQAEPSADQTDRVAHGVGCTRASAAGRVRGCRSGDGAALSFAGRRGSCRCFGRDRPRAPSVRGRRRCCGLPICLSPGWPRSTATR